MKHYIIYIPGLGDHYDAGRRTALRLWRVFGVHTQLVPMQWYEGGSYDEKVIAIREAITRAQKQGYTVSLIGESAGGSIALEEFVANEGLHRLVTLCGVIHPDAAVSPTIYARGPAFKTAMARLAGAIKGLEGHPAISVITSAYDPIVSHKHNRIDNIKPIKIWSVGHLITIALCLTVYSWIVVREIKKPV